MTKQGKVRSASSEQRFGNWLCCDITLVSPLSHIAERRQQRRTGRGSRLPSPNGAEGCLAGAATPGASALVCPCLRNQRGRFAHGFQIRAHLLIACPGVAAKFRVDAVSLHCSPWLATHAQRRRRPHPYGPGARRQQPRRSQPPAVALNGHHSLGGRELRAQDGVRSENWLRMH